MILFLGKELWHVDSTDIAATFVWFSVMAGIWVILLSMITLAIVAIIYRLKIQEFWKSFKIETYLVLGSIVGFLILYLSNLVICT